MKNWKEVWSLTGKTRRDTLIAMWETTIEIITHENFLKNENEIPDPDIDKNEIKIRLTQLRQNLHKADSFSSAMDEKTKIEFCQKMIESVKKEELYASGNPRNSKSNSL